MHCNSLGHYLISVALMSDTLDSIYRYHDFSREGQINCMRLRPFRSTKGCRRRDSQPIVSGGLPTLTAKRCYHYRPANCRRQSHIYEMKHSTEQDVKAQGVQELRAKREDLMCVREVKGYSGRAKTLRPIRLSMSFAAVST